MNRQMGSISSDRSLILHDCGLLVSVVLLSVTFYTARLGFYNDDWAVLATLDLANDHSTAALVGELARNPRIENVR